MPIFYVRNRLGLVASIKIIHAFCDSSEAASEKRRRCLLVDLVSLCTFLHDEIFRKRKLREDRIESRQMETPWSLARLQAAAWFTLFGPPARFYH